MDVKLSGPQDEAVRYTGGPAIITAGAGSGKTRTLTSKIAYLVNELGYDSARILAITFTNKAASEMKSRLQRITGRPARDFPWVRTFHSACFQILKEHCETLGFKKPLVIHSDYQQKSDLKKILARVDVDKKYLGPLGAMISRAKNSGDPYVHLAGCGRLPRKREIYDLYNEALAQQNCVDFDDILMLVRDILRDNPDIRETYRNLFDYVMIDEFQDSNEIQNQIVDLVLRNGNLTVVGDDYQSIYTFRGADPSHFINFPTKYPEARVFKLEENYRSTSEIVAAADAVIARNGRRIEKHCFSVRSGSRIEVRDFTDEGAEAEWVADKCREYRSREGIPYENMAVLYRTKFCSRVFEHSLRYASIPYKMMGGKGFFERREVQDINAYLISAINRKDEASFERIVNVPKRGVGPGAIQKILARRGAGCSFQDACRRAIDDGIVPKKAGVELQALLVLLDRLGGMRPDKAIREMIAETGYLEHMEAFSENKVDFESRKENIEELIYSASQKATIEEYLEDAALIKEDQDDSDGDAGQGVRLSTFHAAKGLEYEVVFVVAAEDGLLPHWRSIGMDSPVDRSHGAGGEDDNLDGLEEERRLMYVAMTRAAERLHLSWARVRRGQLGRPSRFLAEVPRKFLSYEDS